MRFLASASSSFSMFLGMPGSNTRMPTSSSSACGMCTVACLAAIFGIGLVSEVTQPASNIGIASAAAASSLSFMSSPRAESARRLLVVVVFLPEPLLELRIGFLFGGLAQALRDDVVVVADSHLLRPAPPPPVPFLLPSPSDAWDRRSLLPPFGCVACRISDRRSAAGHCRRRRRRLHRQPSPDLRTLRLRFQRCRAHRALWRHAPVLSSVSCRNRRANRRGSFRRPGAVLRKSARQPGPSGDALPDSPPPFRISSRAGFAVAARTARTVARFTRQTGHG